MKRIVPILVFMLFAAGLFAQEKKPWEIDRICGKLEHIQKIPDRKNANMFSEKRKALRDLSLTLYERRGDEPCCVALNVIETARSGRDGHFEFKTKKPGKFWLATNWNSKEYKLPIEYRPEKDSATVCSHQGVALDDDGNSDWWATVTVD